jgi:4'-phosphopantetheinyl transferase
MTPEPARIAVMTVALAAIPEGTWPRLVALLSLDERQAAARFHFERNRREYIAAHALARLMLRDAGGGRPEDWTFTVGAFGKPAVAGHPDLNFNLTHCDGLVACAVSAEVALGIDAEPWDRDAPLDVAARYFSPTEHDWLMRQPAGERGRAFFRIWTLKEAFIKATGRGISQDLQSFAVGFDPLRVEVEANAGVDRTGWRLRQDIVGQRHVLALCWHGSDAAVTLEHADLEALMRGRRSRSD